jgi:hypothetical protein
MGSGMGLKGRAFLAIWHDIAEAGEAEYNAWHTRQHMPERLGVPGFLVGRRYADRNRDHQRYFTLYEGATLETFSSEAYRARLNNPTAWSIRTQPSFLNFARSACVVAASLGRGIGGALATIRLDLADGGAADFEAAAETLAARMLALDGITGAHLGVAAPETTRIRTRETELRNRTSEDVFDALVMVEGIGRHELARATDAAGAMLRETVEIASQQTSVYDLAYVLRAEDLA